MDARAGALVHPDPGEHLRASASAGRDARRRASAVILPTVIREASEFAVFRTFPDEPTFVTHRSVTGPTAVVEGDAPPAGLHGAIVVVERADPGWDWLFGHRIAGLITAFGGSNSHMAIRAAEFDLPAAVGVGPERFAELRNARTVELDCARRRIVTVA